MTSEQIKATKATDLSDTAWLREIALQLAIQNEQKWQSVTAPLPQKHQGQRR